MTDFFQSRRSATPASRVISISVLGRPAKRPSQNAARMALATSAIDLLANHRDWHPIDAILFPAGFLRSPAELGKLEPKSRLDIIAAEPFAALFSGLAASLDQISPGLLIIVGLDTNRTPNRAYRGDQIMAVFDAGGCVSVVRKIYPSDIDTNGWGQAPYPVNALDFGDPGRAVRLPNGVLTELATCYDAFGLSERVVGPTPNRRHIRYGYVGGTTAVQLRPIQRDWFMGAYLDAIEHRQASIILVGVHGFERPGRDGYWQRHGIATASAAMNGIPCIGAAHYAAALPGLQSTPLAARSVPTRHLWAGSRREAFPLQPDARLYLMRRDEPALLLQRFDLP